VPGPRTPDRTPGRANRRSVRAPPSTLRRVSRGQGRGPGRAPGGVGGVGCRTRCVPLTSHSRSMPNASERFLAVAHRKRYGLRTRAHSPPTLSAALGQRVRRRRSASAALQGDFARLLLSRLDDAEPTVAVTRSPNAINARGPGSPSCPSRAVRAVAVSIRKDNFFKFSSTRSDDSPKG
jgi:hypothetical protein